MRILTTKESIQNMIRVLLHSGTDYKTEKWQANLIEENYMTEVCGIYARMQMTGCDLALETGADIPWAEEHFQERIGGRPTNPGEAFKTWPYCEDFKQYLNEQGKFSHTYQERFWPHHTIGGNWDDVVDRLSNEPTSRQAFLSVWHPEDQLNNGVRVPCTIGYWFKVNGGRLDITYLIRSCDARRHLRNDIYMTQRLAQEMLWSLNNAGHQLELGLMDMWIGSLHCFQPDKYALKQQV